MLGRHDRGATCEGMVASEGDISHWTSLTPDIVKGPLNVKLATGPMHQAGPITKQSYDAGDGPMTKQGQLEIWVKDKAGLRCWRHWPMTKQSDDAEDMTRIRRGCVLQDAAFEYTKMIDQPCSKKPVSLPISCTGPVSAYVVADAPKFPATTLFLGAYHKPFLSRRVSRNRTWFATILQSARESRKQGMIIFTARVV